MPDACERELARLPFWGDLSADERESVRRGSETRLCRRGDYILSDQAACPGMIFPLSGELRAFFLSEEGREITLFSRAAGETCVLSAACVLDELTFETHLQAQSDAELLIVSAPTFRRLTQENLHVRCFAYERVADSFSAVVRTLQDILFKRFDQRLSSFLLAQCEQTGTLEVHMTHEQIAQQINTAREVVARMLKRFAADGLLTAGRGVIRIRDTEALRALL